MKWFVVILIFIFFQVGNSQAVSVTEIETFAIDISKQLVKKSDEIKALKNEQDLALKAENFELYKQIEIKKETIKNDVNILLRFLNERIKMLIDDSPQKDNEEFISDICNIVYENICEGFLTEESVCK